MRYTPGQLRVALGIPQETYRHWKKVLRPLQVEKGHSPCFSAGDLVAVAVVQCLVIDCGVRVSALAAVADTLFKLCNVTPWPALERGTLAIEVRQGSVRLQSETAEFLAPSPLTLLPLRKMVESLRSQLVSAGAEEAQSTLRFPLAPLSVPQSVASRSGQ